MENKNVIITGASKGIGKALSYHFAKKKYNLLMIARSADLLIELQQDLKKKHPKQKIEMAELDITNELKVNNIIEEYILKNKKIDVLVNNAGFVKRGTSEIDSIYLDEMLQVNIKGLINVTKKIIPYMKQQNSGYIINMSSRNAKIPRSFLGVYAASKAAVLAYNESLYKELAGHNIKVTALVPGFVNTDMTSDIALDKESLIQPEELGKFVDLILSLSPSVAMKEICFEATPQIGGYA
jgi:short-subunit dehydrogenase